MNVKSKLPVGLITGICVGLILVTILAYVSHFGEKSFSTSKPEHWGQFGDFIGGFLGTVIGVINLVILVYLTQYVADEDNRKVLNQFRFDLYKKIIDEFNEFTPKRFTSFQLDKIRNTLKDAENYDFLFEKDKARYRLEIGSVKLAIGFLAHPVSKTKDEEKEFFEYEGTVDTVPDYEKAKNELLGLLQRAILSK